MLENVELQRPMSNLTIDVLAINETKLDDFELNFMLLLYNVKLFVCIRHLTYNFASSRTFQLCGHHRSYQNFFI